MNPIRSLTPLTYTNVSGTIQLNASIDLTSNATNMTWRFINSSGNITFNVTFGTSNGSTGTLNATRFNTTFGTTQIPDGKYNISMTAINVTGTSVINTSVVNITIDNTPPNVSFRSPASTENFSRGYRSSININVTANDSTTVVNSVTFNVSNGSNSFILVGIKSGGGYNVTLNTSTMVEGNVTIVAIANDSLNNQNKSGNVTIMIDNSGPILTSVNNPNKKINPIDNGNFSPSLANATLLFNLTLRDSLTIINTVRLNITNGTNHTVVVASINPGTNFWNATLNGSGLLEGNHTVHILMNDSLGNINHTNNFTFTVDRTGPTVGIETASNKIETITLSPTISFNFTDNFFGRANCTISVGGSVKQQAYSLNGTPTSVSLGALTNDVTHTYNISCADGSGNSGAKGSTIQMAVVVAAAASSSGGSGGGGGSSAWASKGVKGQYYRKGWSSLGTGAQSFTTSDNALGITKISFDVSKSMRNVYMLVKQEAEIPGKFNGPIYKYIQISPSGSFDQTLISSATIDFVVEKSWLAANKVTSSEVSLYRINNGNFDKLSTTVGTEKGDMITFSASTPGFSYFIIGKEVKKIVAEDPVVVEEPSAPTLEAPAAPAAPESPSATGNAVSESSSSSTPVAAILAIIAVLAIVGVVISKKKKE